MNASPRPRRESGPVAEDYTIDQRWAAYAPSEHARWDALTARMLKELPGRAAMVSPPRQRTLPSNASHSSA